MAGVEPASAVQVQRLSAAMHRRMRELQGEVRSPRGEMQGKMQSAEAERVTTARDHPGTHRSWFKLFKYMDDDGSGKVAYVEFEGLVRHELQLTPKELPEAALKAVWLALDRDGSGHISVGEFGAFMRKGKSNEPAPLTWRAKVEAQKRASGDSVRAARRKAKSSHRSWSRPMPSARAAT